jgi:phosphoglycerol transferase MdoB-like AlkP superfamily enzyme
MTLLQNLDTIFENPSYLIPILIWSLIWKGIGLWKCGRNNQIRWFIVMLVLNTVGILEIVYLVWFQRDYNQKRK